MNQVEHCFFSIKNPCLIEKNNKKCIYDRSASDGEPSLLDVRGAELFIEEAAAKLTHTLI